MHVSHSHCANILDFSRSSYRVFQRKLFWQNSSYQELWSRCLSHLRWAPTISWNMQNQGFTGLKRTEKEQQQQKSSQSETREEKQKSNYSECFSCMDGSVQQVIIFCFSFISSVTFWYAEDLSQTPTCLEERAYPLWNWLSSVGLSWKVRRIKGSGFLSVDVALLALECLWKLSSLELTQQLPKGRRHICLPLRLNPSP